mmetsp:Transcript_12818/g.21388  ORF Transcript_12818/g.21388 Transcript_12818/m.21388 type:complete len:112 (+) Transcript_12818:186-521(+)
MIVILFWKSGNERKRYGMKFEKKHKQRNKIMEVELPYWWHTELSGNPYFQRRLGSMPRPFAGMSFLIVASLKSIGTRPKTERRRGDGAILLHHLRRSVISREKSLLTTLDA